MVPGIGFSALSLWVRVHPCQGPLLTHFSRENEKGRQSAPNGRGGWTPLRPLRGLQETRVATREESGVLGFPSRRGLTPRGSLDAFMSSPASSWWEASLAESSGLRGSTEMASSRQHPNSLQGWLGLLSLAATLPALSFCEPAPAQPGHHMEVQSISLLCWITRGGKQAVPVQSEAPVQCGCCGVSTPQDPNAQAEGWGEVGKDGLGVDVAQGHVHAPNGRLGNHSPGWREVSLPGQARAGS